MDARNVRLRSDVFTMAVVVACAGYVLGLSFMPGFREVSPLSCFIKRAVGLNCPTCGLTRAMACCARLDFVTAVRFNPLVVLVAPIVAVYSADLLLRIAGRRGLYRMVPTRLAAGTWTAVSVLFLVLLFVRTATWIKPELNPSRWLIPPVSFTAP